jgi:hypothetical protein
MSRPVSERGQKIRRFAAKWDLQYRTAERMLMRSPQLLILDDTTVRVFVNMSKRSGGKDA